MNQDLMNKNIINDTIEEDEIQTLSTKLRRLAKILRDGKGFYQIKGEVYRGDNMVCATGLLLLKAGVSKYDLDAYYQHEGDALRNYYGFSEKDMKTKVPSPYRHWQNLFLKKECTAGWLIHGLNDKGWKWEQMAEYLDETADKLEAIKQQTNRSEK